MVAMGEIPEDWHFAEALIEGGHNRSRSPSPSGQLLDPDAVSDAYGGLGAGTDARSRAQTLSASDPRPRAGTLSVSGTPAAGRSRASSSVQAQNVLDVLDTSAWGESIRRSFTTRASSVGARGSAEREASTEPMPPLPGARGSASSQGQGSERYDHEHEQ